jgi:hypothetical protein
MDARLAELCSGTLAAEGWAMLFRTKEILALTGKELDVLSGFHRLLETNPSSGNINNLFAEATAKIRDLRLAKTTPSLFALEQTCVALHIVALVLNFLAASLPPLLIRKQLGLDADWPKARHLQDGNSKHKTQLLLDELVAVLAMNPAPGWGHDLALCSASVLIAACSTQLYLVSGQQDDLFLDYLFVTADAKLSAVQSQGDKDVSSTIPARLLRGLLLHALGAVAVPPDSIVAELFGESSSTSAMVVGSGRVGGTTVVSVLISLLMRIPFQDVLQQWLRTASTTTVPTTPSSSTPPTSFAKSPLGERCSGLLMILLHNRRTVGYTNAFRDVLCLLHDDKLDDGTMSDDLETHGSSRISIQRRINMDFSYIADSLSKSVPSESGVILLYTLLHGHPTFLDTLLAADKIEPLLNSVLRGLYLIPDSKASIDQLYVLIVCALMLVQDVSLRNVLPTLRTDAPWYRDRSLTDTNLADLAILCCLRTTMHSLFRLHDKYLLSNCFALLLNLAPMLSSCTAYTAERLVKIVFQLAKRFIKDATSPEDGEFIVDVQETLVVILKVVGISLRSNRRRANAQLLYAFIHEHDKINALSHPLVNSLSSASEPGDIECVPLNDIVNLTTTYFRKLEESTQTDGNSDAAAFKSAADAVNLLQALIDDDCKDREDGASSMYTYTEGESSEHFFIPCAWASTLRFIRQLSLYKNAIVLFDARDDHPQA